MEDSEYEAHCLLGPASHWFCGECRPKAMKAVATDMTIEEKIDEMTTHFEERIQSLEDDMASKASSAGLAVLQSRIEKLESADRRVTAMQRDMAQLAEKIDLIVHEPSEKIGRDRNVLLKRVLESDETVPTAASAQDKDRCISVLDGIECADRPTHVRRLGTRKDNLTRPLLLRFEKASSVQSILGTKHHLKDLNDWRKDVFICPDETALERQRISARITRAANRNRQTFLASQPQPQPANTVPVKQIEPIEQRDVGRVIGRNGCTITNLQTKYDCKISISRIPNPHGLVDVTVLGPQTSCEACIAEIRRHLMKCHSYGASQAAATPGRAAQ